MMSYFKLCIALQTPLVFWCASIAAQDELELIVDPETIALIQGEPLASSVSSVVASVVTREEIKQYGYRSIEEALSHVTGFHVGISRLSGFPVYSIRGFASNPSLLFLVNNEPYSSSLWGSAETTIGRIPIDMIDRIEVVRGPGNSVYGTGAMTGVVNIITRDDAALDAVSLSAGPNETHRFTATKGISFNNKILNMGIDVAKSDGHSTDIDRDFQSTLDSQFSIDPAASNSPTTVSFDSNSIGLNFDFINLDHKVSARLAVSNDVSLGVGFLNVVDSEGTWDSRALNLSYQFPLIDRRNIRLSGNSYFQHRNYSLNNINFFPDGAFNSFPDGVEASLLHRENYYGVGLNGEIYKHPKHDISFELRTSFLDLEVIDYEANFERGELGIVPLRDGVNTSKTGESFSRFTGSMQLNDEWNITSTVHATLGIGYEYNSKEETQVTPRFAFVWNALSDTTLKFLYGQGVRTPALLETIDVGLPAVINNDLLRPETLTSYDLVMEHHPTQNLLVKVNLFVHNTKNQINYTNAGINGFEPKNVGVQDGKGFELESIYAHSPALQYRFYGLYQENRGGYLPNSPNADIGYSPHTKAGMQVRGAIKNYTYGLSYTYTGSRDRPFLDKKPSAQVYSLVDAAVSYTTKSDFVFKAKIENLFDRQVREANISASADYDIELPRRSIFLGIEKIFK